MEKTINTNQNLEEVRVIIVGVDYYRDKKFEYYMAELENLVLACDYNVVGKMTQKLPKVDNRHYIGTGKIQDLKDLVEELDANLIILNNEIGGMQNRNIEKICGCMVMDRTQLILEIFASRAKTKEAQLQVSIAQLKYQKPRMLGSYENLGRQGGGSAGTVARGSGEKKIEIDRRKIDSQISLMEKELEKFVSARALQRNERDLNNIPIVSIVGYTNAGKSTLMNALVNDEKKVFEKDMLFATLDTSVRRITLDNKQTFLLVDTVGFVSNLPTELVKAFRSTLEEIESSNLIVHLTDLTNDDRDVHREVVHETLTNIRVEDIKQIEVNNKMDLVDSVLENEINISAKNDINIDKLMDIIKNEIFKDHKLCTLKLGYDMMSQISAFNEYTYVSDPEYTQDGVSVEVILSVIDQQKFARYIVK